jgi:phosphoglycerate kinase
MDSTDTQTVMLEQASDDMRIFDIGPKTVKNYEAVLNQSQTIIWNGPLGCFEYPAFEAGTKNVLKTIAALKSCQTILGGGDTLDALKKFGVSKSAFTHVSTGGGAMLEFLEGKELPGIEVLKS